MKEKLKNVFFKVWYWYISTVDKNAEVIFMNYGYSKNNHKIDLEKDDEKNRYSAQLYNLVATGIDIKGKNILEVGCGRGGGLSYMHRYLLPNSSTGVDLDKRAIEFCKKNYTYKNINFSHANAQNLNFQNNAFDVVINVESSHRYDKMNEFLSEVYAVLKPDGFFLFADFRLESEIEKLNEQFKTSKLKILKNEKITANVLEALNLSTKERENLIHKIAPKLLHGLGKKFAATPGTATYIKFLTGKFEYLFYILKK
ncbi:MAG: class I SAM-dependent methyltransferase [Bacteroidota bacterium]|nr:class I SAM-dependent methyltransferase [Bacteroidota bacterium]